MSAEENVATNGEETLQNEDAAPEAKSNENSGANSNSAAEAETAMLKEELKKAKEESASFKDSWARERAEFQNFKRRAASDYMTVKKETTKNLVLKLLTPIDNLERVGAGMTITDEMKPFFDGVEMIKREFNSLLEKENIFKVIPKGEIFDPMTMEAIASDESEEYNEETVIDVYQAGYVFKENNESTTLRPSRVRVGRPKF